MHKLEDLDLHQLMMLKEQIMRINVIIHDKATRLALEWLRSKPPYSRLQWSPVQSSGASGIDLVAKEGSEVKVVAEVKTNKLTGTDSNKKSHIEEDLLRMIRNHPKADKYLFLVYEETAEFARSLLSKRNLEREVFVVNVVGTTAGDAR